MVHTAVNLLTFCMFEIYVMTAKQARSLKSFQYSTPKAVNDSFFPFFVVLVFAISSFVTLSYFHS